MKTSSKKLPVKNENKIVVNKVMKEFTKRFKISPMQLISHNKNSHISDIRQLYCKLRYENHGVTYTETGREIDRNHTTVRYAVMRMNQLLSANDKRIVAMWEGVKDIPGYYF